MYCRSTFVVVAGLLSGCTETPKSADTADTADTDDTDDTASTFEQVYASSAVGAGTHLAMALDDAGAPMVAFYQPDPTGGDARALLFTRRDPTSGAWTEPVTVVTSLGGEYTATRGERWIGLARDASTGRIGVAYLVKEAFCGPIDGNTEWTTHVIYSDDDGATWGGDERVSLARYTRNDPVEGVEVCNTSAPRIAMHAGVVHAAWAADAGEAESDFNFYKGYFYATAASADAWTHTLLPHDGDDARQGNAARLDLAVDADGNAAITYVMRSVDAARPYNAAVLYARPDGAAVRVVDSADRQNDEPQVALAFDGTRPRVATHLQVTDTDNEQWFFQSDDGAAFTGGAIPNDGSDGGGSYIDLAVQEDEAVLAYDFSSGAADGSCGGPKLARSSGALTDWSICGADDASRQFLGDYLSATMDASGALVLAFYTNSADTSGLGRFEPGIVLYEER